MRAPSQPGDLVLDPFLGSSTTAAVARKLGRRFVGIEIDSGHWLAALRRLKLAYTDPHMQGFEDGVFWERNSRPRKA
jgi:site-specific DNA-methyltransferase (adenine-specific)